MPKRENLWPDVEGSRLAKMIEDMGDRDKFNALFQQMPMPRPHKVMIIGHHSAGIRHAMEHNMRGAFEMKTIHSMQGTRGLDPKDWRVILVHGWRDAIGFSGRQELKALGFEIEVAE